VQSCKFLLMYAAEFVDESSGRCVTISTAFCFAAASMLSTGVCVCENLLVPGPDIV